MGGKRQAMKHAHIITTVSTAMMAIGNYELQEYVIGNLLPQGSKRVLDSNLKAAKELLTVASPN